MGRKQGKKQEPIQVNFVGQRPVCIIACVCLYMWGVGNNNYNNYTVYTTQYVVFTLLDGQGFITCIFLLYIYEAV